MRVRIVRRVTRRLQRQGGEPEPTAEREVAAHAAPPAPAAPLTLFELQRGAGNAAVARVLAREPAPIQLGFPPRPAAPGLGGLPSFGPRLGPATLGDEQLAPEVERDVDAWLRMQRATFDAMAREGKLSMPEVIDAVRRHVPSAADAKSWPIRVRVTQIVGEVPMVRGKNDIAGQHATAQASIANALPKPPTSVTVSSSKTSLTVRIAEAELKTAVDGAHVTAKGDKEGAEVEVKKGDVKAGANAKWDGSAFGVKTEVGPVKFGGKVERKGESWKWSGGLVFQLAGDEIEELPDIGGVVGSAHGAIVDSLGHLAGGGSPADGYVTSRMGNIKPAIDAVGKVAARSGKSGATLRITASGEDGGFTAGVSLVIAF